MVKKDCMNCIYHRFFIEYRMNIKKERKLWKQRYVEAVKGSRFLTKSTTKGNRFLVESITGSNKESVIDSLLQG